MWWNTHISLTVDLASARMFSAVIFGTYFFYHKDVWIATTNYYMYFNLSVLFPLTAKLNKFYSFITFNFTN